MAKITIETQGDVLELWSELESKRQDAFQIATGVLSLLKELDSFEDCVEIIKVICWGEKKIGGGSVERLGMDFQLVFIVSSEVFPELAQKFKVIAQHESLHPDKVSVYENELKPDKHLGNIPLRNEKIDILAAALIGAMQMVIHKRESDLEEVVETLNRANEELDKLLTKTLGRL